MKNTAVIVARFQFPVLDSNHMNMIKTIRDNHEKLIIILTETAIPGSKNNPLSVNSRKDMIRDRFPMIPIDSIRDHPSASEWSRQLDNLVNKDRTQEISMFDIDGTLTARYSGRYKVNLLPVPESNEVRGSFKQEELSGSEDFRKGVAFAYQSSYTKVYPTVDVALFRSEYSQLLLGYKDLDKKWRLIGGFADPEDHSFEEAAARELKEEAGEISFTKMVYEGSFKIDDWRYRNEVDKIISTLFSTTFVSGDIKGSDDIAEVKWFSLEEVAAMIDDNLTAPEHSQMLQRLIEKYLKK